MNNTRNTFSALSVSFYCVHKITFYAPSCHKNTLCVLFNIYRVILELLNFLLEVEVSMTLYNFDI